uniref:Uncharacterized protein n=1 Tax=Solanum lycopersicum TaxID=4081 RepID=A0A3Q7FHL4_SOLLC
MIITLKLKRTTLFNVLFKEIT